jgi:hypothetical protein
MTYVTLKDYVRAFLGGGRLSLPCYEGPLWALFGL